VLLATLLADDLLCDDILLEQGGTTYGNARCGTVPIKCASKITLLRAGTEAQVLLIVTAHSSAAMYMAAVPSEEDLGF
jgi:hypothetical protein